MTIKKNQLKKFRVNELKKIMKEYKIKGRSGRKGGLIEKIIASSKWDIISKSLTLPVRNKRKFNEKQLAVQKLFASKNKKNEEKTEEKTEEKNEEKTEEKEKILLEEREKEINKIIERKIKLKKRKRKTSLTIMSYNVKMLSPLVFELLSKKRAKWIPKELNEKHSDNDVLIVQELFDGGAEDIFDKEMKKYGYYHSEKVGGNFLLKGKIEDGGVKIYSKYKIEKQKQTIFGDSSKEDALAGKGAIRILIHKDGIPINIIGTHLQSGRKEKEIKIKKTQFSQLSKDLIKESQDVLIIGGDMNIARNKQRELLDDILQSNGLSEFKYTKEKTTGTDFTEKGEKAKWLDYFFYKPSKRFDIEGTIEVVKDIRIENGYKKPKEERIDVGEKAKEFITSIFKKKKNNNNHKVFSLSDHFPIKMKLHITEKDIKIDDVKIKKDVVTGKTLEDFKKENEILRKIIDVFTKKK
jgi:endonuclease/exonuclease/phosphatase family metal-dependent hydrolase